VGTARREHTSQVARMGCRPGSRYSGGIGPRRGGEATETPAPRDAPRGRETRARRLPGRRRAGTTRAERRGGRRGAATVLRRERCGLPRPATGGGGPPPICGDLRGLDGGTELNGRSSSSLSLVRTVDPVYPPQVPASPRISPGPRCSRDDILTWDYGICSTAGCLRSAAGEPACP
jgi:hypothetical protein